VPTPTRSNGSARDKRSARLSSEPARIVPTRVGATATSSSAPAESGRNGAKRPAGPGNLPAHPKAEPKIIFQKYFRSVGPRTYAAQVKELSNGNHLLVLTEGKRDEQTGEVRKSRVLIFGEDFGAFFGLLKETAGFIRANPLSEEIREKRSRFWARKNKEAKAPRSSPQ